MLMASVPATRVFCCPSPPPTAPFPSLPFPVPLLKEEQLGASKSQPPAFNQSRALNSSHSHGAQWVHRKALVLMGEQSAHLGNVSALSEAAWTTQFAFAINFYPIFLSLLHLLKTECSWLFLCSCTSRSFTFWSLLAH